MISLTPFPTLFRLSLWQIICPIFIQYLFSICSVNH